MSAPRPIPERIHMILSAYPEASDSGRRFALSVREYADILPECYEDRDSPDAQRAISVFSEWLQMQLGTDQPAAPVIVKPASLAERLINLIVDFLAKIDAVKTYETFKRNFLQPVETVTITRLGRDETRLEHNQTRLEREE